MKSRIYFILFYFLFWLVVFWIYKFIFLSYHSSLYSHFSLKEIFYLFLFGTRMDLSFCSYLTFLPLLAIMTSFFIGKKTVKIFLSIYTIILLILVSTISVVDFEIFKVWGFRIDSTLFKYLKNPTEAAASAGSSPILLLTLILLFSGFALGKLYFFIQKKFHFDNTNLKQKLAGLSVSLACIPLLIIALRGGLQLAPMNQSGVYFSNNLTLNQGAVNSCWNLCYSILENNHDEYNPFESMYENEAKEYLKKLYPQTNPPIRIIKDGNINVVLIIWESFTGKAVESLGGKKGITPGFEKLIHEGVFFNNIYASGDRSDKGLIAVLSAFPAQPTTSIMNKTTKAARLPSITHELKEKGYQTSFYYGGEPEFANIKSYLLNSGFDNIVSKWEFPMESWNSKWGAHDEIVFNRLLNDLKKENKKVFSTLFTLTSHEPFEIPSKPLLEGDDEETMFLNSLHYTDSCLYDFIKRAEREPWWNNTLFIITADHGHRLPGNGFASRNPTEFMIPMLWLGGALNTKDTIITKIGNQTDLARTLLNQLNQDPEKFPFSKDLLSDNSIPFSYYAFNNGFGYISPRGKYVFENLSRTYILKDSAVSQEDMLNGKAYLQYSFQEYLNK